jgi:1,4-alpha-glucan branching enzyme
MKKIYLIFALLGIIRQIGAVNVTFQVDMSQQTVSPQGVHVAGSFNGWSTTATPMTPAGNNVYTVTLDLNSGTSYQYKFINGDTWAGEEIVPAACGVPNGYGGYNREITVGSSVTVLPVVCFSQCGPCPTTINLTLVVDMSEQTVSPQGVHVAGSFNNWSTSATPMSPIGNGKYSATVAVSGNSSYQYKFINGDTWAGEETVPAACGVPNGFGGYNREVIVANGDTTLQAVCFSQCGPCNLPQVQLTLQVDMSQQTVSAQGVHVAGTFNGWSASATTMNPAGNGIYTATVNVDQNSTQQYVFINGDDWAYAETVPASCGVPNGLGGYNREISIGNSNTTTPLVCFSSCDPCPGMVNLTLQVDLGITPASSQGVHVAGTFNGWSTTATPMTLTSGSVYSVTIAVSENTTYEYVFINGDTWADAEVVPAGCGVPNGTGGYNRQVIVGNTPVTVPVVCFSRCEACPPQVQVTFRVDMSLQTVAPEGVHIAGSFQGWDPGASPMTQTVNNIWESTFMLYQGETYQYKFINGNTWAGEETVPAACGVPNGSGGYNREVTVGNNLMILPAVCFSSCDPCPVPYIVTFRVDMSQQTVSPDGVHIAGSFQGWDPGATPMIDAGNGIFTYTTQILPGEEVQYKYINGNTWAGEETVPEACGTPNGTGGFNRYFTMTAADTLLGLVCFSECGPCQGSTFVDVVFYVDMSQQTVSPDGVNLAGSFQGWNPSSTPMAYLASGIYQATVLLQEGQYIEYKFVNGSDWSGAEQVPAECGVATGVGGFNRYLTVPAGGTSLPYVCFSSCDPCLVGIPEEQSVDLKIYPNPSTGHITIEWNQSFPESLVFRLTSITGQELYHHAKSWAPGHHTLELYIPSFKGIAILSQTREDGSTLKRKLIFIK